MKKPLIRCCSQCGGELVDGQTLNLIPKSKLFINDELEHTSEIVEQLLGQLAEEYMEIKDEMLKMIKMCEESKYYMDIKG
jgi:hypothetical protein